MAEEDDGRRQPRPVLVGHYVAVTIVLPQLIGRRGHVKVDVAVNKNNKTLLHQRRLLKFSIRGLNKHT